MMLHGSWSYGIQQSDGGDFVSSGSLGYLNFPPVDGGKGDPSDTVGNPAQYLSISSKASDDQKKIAKDFFTKGILDDEEVKQWIGTGGVPVVKGTQELLAADKNADFLTFTYDIASNAKTFAQSWDQALSPTAAETLLDNIVKLFQLSISPQQFADNLNAVIGQ
jgi:raffinose/stachyose/melibiose transport system substrate-binding protein